MRILGVATAAVMTMLSANAWAEVDTKIELGTGFSKLKIMSLEETGHRHQATIQARVDNGLIIGVGYEFTRYSDLDLQSEETRLDIGWSVGNVDEVTVGFGLTGIRGTAETTGFKASDNAYGIFADFNARIADGVTAGIDLTYVEEDEGNEDVIDIGASLEIMATESVSASLRYETSTSSSSGTPDLDQESMSLILGLHF